MGEESGGWAFAFPAVGLNDIRRRPERRWRSPLTDAVFDYTYSGTHSMRLLSWRLVWCLVLVPFLLFGGNAGALLQEAGAPAKLLAMADELIPVVVRLRGLEPKEPIRKGVKSREEISQFISREADAQFEKGELRSEGLVLQKLGLIPADLDYVPFVIKLLSEQAGGYYDPAAKSLYIASWLPADQQRPAMVHELTHALQDQYHDLDGMIKRDRKGRNDDRVLAHMAIAEGDATAVMLNYVLEPVGRSYTELPDIVFIMQAQLSLMNDQFEVLKSAPEYLKQNLVFPYSYGAAFMQKVRAHNEPWSVVDKIYSDLPSSTEQIIHPDKYLGERDNPLTVEVADPTPQLGKEWKVVYSNVLGEFGLSLLLQLNLAEEVAKRAATGWGGDQLILVEDGGGHSAVFAETAWDTQESTDRFFGALSTWLQHRYPKAKKSGESESGFALVSEGEYRSVQRTGSRVRLIVGLPESLGNKFGTR
jgi:hypothetical protein